MDIDLAKRDITDELEPHHDHACDPEEDDVKTGDQHIGGIERLYGIDIFGPAKCRERKKR